MSELPTKEDLKKLPLRSILAYAARCARRVQPLYISDDSGHKDAVDNAILLAESFARGVKKSNQEARNAISASQAAIPKCSLPPLTDDVEKLDAHDTVYASVAAAKAARATARAAHDAIEIAEDCLAHNSTMTEARAACVAFEASCAAVFNVNSAASVAKINKAAVKFSESFAAKIRHAAICDYQNLLRKSKGTYTDLGDPVDFKALGPLWPNGGSV